MIKFESVCKTYDNGFHAVQNISFAIKRGELIFVAGHSGAGKSTVLKLIAGILRPSSGNILIDGSLLNEFSEDAICAYRQQIGLVFQDHKILFDYSVLDNILIPLRISGFGKEEAHQRAQEALKKVGLAGREKNHPLSLSGGEQQRLCIARAIVKNPAIIIADEPTANLDRATALDIMELFKTFHQNGATIIISAHDETLMQNYGHRVLRLQKGRFSA